MQHQARSRAAGWVLFASQAPARVAPELSQARQDRPRPCGRTSGPPVFDPRTLTYGQLDHCHAVFEDFRDKSLLPANEAYRDDTRKALDRALLFGITSMLQLDPGLEEGLDLLRK